MSADDPTPTGADMARSALAQAKADAAARAAAAATAAGKDASVAAARRRRAGATPTSRPKNDDPVGFGASIQLWLEARGYAGELAVASVLGRWESLVGADLASHCEPVSLRGGELTLAAESTAWATQIRLLTRQLIATLAAELGPEVVTKIKVHGPTAPSWNRGRLRAAGGRGPRDTYG